jgi:hypothetical protein
MLDLDQNGRRKNKANRGRGGLGIDDGLLMIDDLGQGNGCRPRLATCQRRAKQSQFGSAGPSVLGHETELSIF